MPHLSSTRTRWLLIGLGLSALAGAPMAIGQAGGDSDVSLHEPLIAGARTPSVGTLFRPTELRANAVPYALSLVNQNPRGGALSGTCRALINARRPCLRATNSANGRAFEFRFRGELGGMFVVGGNVLEAFPDAKPFVTNATGVATGLNADRVDGLHAQDIIDAAVSRSSVQEGAQGPQGPQGAQGVRGPQGPQGLSGPPGTPFVGSLKTAANTNYGGRRVEDLPNELLSSTAPSSASQGVDLLSSTSPSLVLDPGTYVIHVTVRAYDLAPAQRTDPTKSAYGVAQLFLDGAPVTLLTTPLIPNDGFNFAMATDTAVVGVSTGADGLLSLRGVVRQNQFAATGSSAQAGATVIVTEVNGS